MPFELTWQCKKFRIALRTGSVTKILKFSPCNILKTVSISFLRNFVITENQNDININKKYNDFENLFTYGDNVVKALFKYPSAIHRKSPNRETVDIYGMSSGCFLIWR